MTDIHDNLPEADGNQNEATKSIENVSEDNISRETISETTDEAQPQSTNEPLEEKQEETTKTETKDEIVVEPTPQAETEEMTDEDLEKDDEDESVESDEEELEHTVSEELVLPDYSQYEPLQLIEDAEKLFSTQEAHRLKGHFDSIRKMLLDHLNAEKKEKLAEFIEGGGVEMDFEFIQPLRQRFKKVYTEYRTKRQSYYKALEDKLESNLTIKKDLIEKIKDIVSKEESIGDTFKEFNNLQQEWRNTGPVPRNESDAIWKTYHHHVENFYEFIKINKELRDLDFKKNHEVKELLISKVEALADEKDIKKAFLSLQDLHKKWKRVGPVERDFREPMWEEFSAATKKLHDRREEYYEEMREKNDILIAEKRSLVQKVAEFPFQNIKTHSKWQEAIKGVEAVRQEFRKIGRIHHPENDKIWDEFREVLRGFNKQKNIFYKDLKKDQSDNLTKKLALLEAARSLKESEDWKDTTNQLKRIQADWKKIGHVPRQESDKIWKQFREACNYFFDRLTAYNKDLDKALESNFIEKTALLEKLKLFKTAGDQKADVANLKSYINEWKGMGRVPRDKGSIESEFNKVLDTQFGSIDLDRKESQRIRYENKMNSLSNNDGDDRQLRKEKDYLRKKMDDAKKELNTLETNMGFFTSTTANNPFMKEAEKKIKNQQLVIDDLQEKMKMLTVAIREINKPIADETASEATETPEG